MSKLGFSIRLFVVDGVPDGLRLVEKSNWVGRGVICPRSVFADSKCRREFDKTGVYILTGPSEIPDTATVYIGEGDPAKPRLESHFAKKDFWTSLILFVSKDDNLNKAHVQYLEARLIQLAKEANRSILDNGNTPQEPSLSEQDVADAEGFLSEMLLIFPVIGVNAFEQPAVKVRATTTLAMRAKDLVAEGYEVPQGFLVMKGSEAPNEHVPSTPPFVVDLRRSLIERRVLVPEGKFLVLSQDYVFDSPSTAAAVMLARNANGRIEWRDAEGRTLRELQSGTKE